MLKNFKDYNQIQKRNNTLNVNSRSNYNKQNPVQKRQKEEENDFFAKKMNKFQDNNTNKRYLTPLGLRYQGQSFDNNQNDNNFSRISRDNNNMNINNNAQNEINKNDNDNEVFYYKNLYQQTKNNLNKEKQKNEENQIINEKLNKENMLLNEKLNNLTHQLDRVINLVGISNSQNIKNMNIKQEEINQLKKRIELLQKNDTIEKRKSLEEKESMEKIIRQLNSNNQNTQTIIKDYENKIE